MRYAFYFFLSGIVIFLVIISLISKNESNAMIAMVEARVTAVSYEDVVKIEKIHVVPGQQIKKGDLLLEAISPDLDLDIEQKINQIFQLNLEIKAVNSESQTEIALIESRNNLRIEEERSDIRLLEKEIEELKSSGAVVESITGKSSNNAGLKYQEIKEMQRTIQNLLDQKAKEISSKKEMRLNRMTLLIAEREIAKKEVEALERAKQKLTRRAENDGTIGNVFVEINELISPLSKLLTIYELKPSLIKAYANESTVGTLKLGDKVLVKAANREINVSGVIEEIGTRVTDYPSQINPGSETRYGQEIFIRIPQEHDFLDGEKVFVYPIRAEK